MLVRSLLLQFSAHDTDSLNALRQLYIQCNTGLVQPEETKLRDLLSHAIARAGKSYIVVDDLDECTDHRKLSSVLHDLVAREDDGVRLFATSRGLEGLRLALAPSVTDDFTIRVEDVDSDIRLYIRDRLAHDSELKTWSVDIKDIIEQDLMQKANGMSVFFPFISLPGFV